MVGARGIGGASLLLLAAMSAGWSGCRCRQPERSVAEPAATTPAAVPSKPPLPLQWVALEGGAFSMGRDGGDDDEEPAHEVKVAPFELNRAEVTVHQYRRCVVAGGCGAPLTGPRCNWARAGRDNHPVNCLSRPLAETFCAWAGARLPTEAEWEFAARGGAGQARRYPWGAEPASCDRAVMPDDKGPGCGEGTTAPVCSRPAGNSRHGLCDLSGNVWEWVADCWHKGYVGAPADGSARLADCQGIGRVVVRGSSFLNGTVDNLRSSSRDSSPAAEGYFSIGFRCARSKSTAR